MKIFLYAACLGSIFSVAFVQSVAISGNVTATSNHTNDVPSLLSMQQNGHGPSRGWATLLRGKQTKIPHSEYVLVIKTAVNEGIDVLDYHEFITEFATHLRSQRHPLQPAPLHISFRHFHPESGTTWTLNVDHTTSVRRRIRIPVISEALALIAKFSDLYGPATLSATIQVTGRMGAAIPSAYLRINLEETPDVYPWPPTGDRPGPSAQRTL